MHIFFATDGSPSARFAQEQILAVPWRTPVHVTVMMVLSVPNPPFASLVPTTRLRDMRTQAQLLLDQIHRELEDKVGSIGQRIHVGKPGVKIVEMASACRADLVAVGSQGIGMYKELFLGSVSDYVANHAHCSVLVTKTPPRGKRRFLLALGESVYSAEVVRWMEELDLSEGARVHLVKVFRSRNDYLVRAEKGREERGIAPEKFGAWSGSPEVLEELLSRKLEAGGAKVTAEVRFGHTAREILASTAKFGPDLLLFGSKDRDSVPGWAMGRVAQHLIDQAPCSVVIVRAPGRESPDAAFP